MNDNRIVSEEKPFGSSGTFNNFEHNKPITRLIDYIFISKNNKLKDLKYPSIICLFM